MGGLWEEAQEQGWEKERGDREGLRFSALRRPLDREVQAEVCMYEVGGYGVRDKGRAEG